MKSLIPVTIALELLDLVSSDFKLNLPNIPMSTMGGILFWETIVTDNNGWRVQQHTLTRHVRILDDQDVRRAWGTLEGMLNVLRQRKSIESEFGNK